MTTPVRLQLSRRKGFNLQAHSRAVNGLPAVNCARPGPWGNPFIVGRDGTTTECVELYRALLGFGPCLTCRAEVDDQLAAKQYLLAHLDDLRGNNLACWCKPWNLCHVGVIFDVLRRVDEKARRQNIEKIAG